MANRINIDLAEIPRFFKSIEEVCASLCQNQRQIDSAFNTVQTTWRDRNAAITGNRLLDTAQDIAKFYSGLSVALAYVVRVCNNRADYIEAERFPQPHLQQFSSNLKEITSVEDSVISTDPDALEEFKNALDKYIQSISDNVERLNEIYRAVGKSWDDAQYENFGIEISKFGSKMQLQVDILDKIVAFLKGRIEVLRRGDV